ncbi:MAG: DUF3488 domain-containing protein [Planctomycetes bacterium]|nr:DUF3488 domain-containing protein [Planctomycetota bacterium]
MADSRAVAHGVTQPLFPFLLVLGLLDLAFVQATEVVSWRGLLPLWLLTAVAPWLRGLQRHRVFRVAWNGTVLVVFGLLCHHALTTGLLHMLEDGLLLAILCQVHLLHNVGARQRPDLVFFNSLLIAFITSFFVTDLQWSVLFVLHAFALIAALQANTTIAAVAPDAARALRRMVIGDSVRRTLLVGLVTTAVFVLLPRDFQRRGWLETTTLLQSRHEVELADRIVLGGERSAARSDALVLRVVPAAGEEVPPSHWRAMVFTGFDGTTWLPPRNGARAPAATGDAPWRLRSDGTFLRSTGATQRALAVQQFGARQSGLLLPLTASVVRCDPPGALLQAGSHGLLQAPPEVLESASPLQFAVRTQAMPKPSPVERGELARCTQLPPNLPRALAALAAQFDRQLPKGVATLPRAEHAAAWLRSQRRYQLPGQPGFARSFTDFLLGTGAGHCEYFAAALALVLRVQGVPCRMVGGFLVQEFDAATGAWLARAKHAHAWVEVFADDGRWHEIDPTPSAQDGPLALDGGSLFGGMLERCEAMWQAVVGFDAAARRRWLAAVYDLPQGSLRWLRTHPLAAAGLLVLALGGIVARRVGRRATVRAVRELERAAAAAGLRLLPGETPRELLARAQRSAVPAPGLARLTNAAMAHEAARYARTLGVSP